MDVADFGILIYDFHQSVRLLEKILLQKDTLYKNRHALVTTGIETCGALNIFFENYIIVYKEWILSEVRINRGDLDGLKSGSFDAFSLITSKAQMFFVSFKTALLFLRMYQDALYKCLNGTSSGSMSAIKNEKNPVRILFEKEMPHYTEWFLQFKDKRDHVKFGRSCSITGPRDDLGIIFNEVTEHNGIVADIKAAFHLSDLIKAVSNSIQVTSVVSSYFEKANE